MHGTGSGLCHGSTVVRSLVGKPEPNKLYRAEILSLRTNISGNIFDSVVSYILDMFSCTCCQLRHERETYASRVRQTQLCRITGS